jgi:hypothetical protein
MRRELEIITRFGLALGATALVACGGSAKGDAAGMDAGGGGSDAGSMDAGGGMDAAEMLSALGDAVSGTCVTSAVLTRGGGVVKVSQFHGGTTLTSPIYSCIGAGFSSPPMGTNPCTVTQMGMCMATRCTIGAGGPGQTSTAVSAGNITVSGAQLATAAVLMPGMNETYSSPNVTTRVFNGGDMLTIQGSGDPAGVPAFNGMVTAPSDITLSAPVFTSGQPLALNRSIDLPIHWTTAAGMPTGNVVVHLYSSGQGVSGDVKCAFPINSAGGMAVVPTGILSTIPPTAAGDTSGIQIGVADAAMVTAGDNDIFLSVSGSAGTTNNANALLGQATFQ